MLPLDRAGSLFDGLALLSGVSAVVAAPGPWPGEKVELVLVADEDQPKTAVA